MGYYDDKEVDVYKAISKQDTEYKLNIIKKLEKDISLVLSDETKSLLLQKINNLKLDYKKSNKEYNEWNKLSQKNVKYVDWDYVL